MICVGSAPSRWIGDAIDAVATVFGVSVRASNLTEPTAGPEERVAVAAFIAVRLTSAYHNVRRRVPSA